MKCKSTTKNMCQDDKTYYVKYKIQYTLREQFMQLKKNLRQNLFLDYNTL